jgi:hypothetical protein
MPRDFLAARARSLEDAFFMKEDAILLQKRKELAKMLESRQVLAEVSGISNEAVLAKLVKLNVTPDVLASLAVIPLIEVAWADGEIDGKEHAAIMAGAEKAGIGSNTVDYTLMEQWLKHRPGPELLEAWKHYIHGLCEELAEDEKQNLKHDLLQRAQTVAEASGSFLGLTSGISDSEKDMLAKLESAFKN